MIVGSRAFFKSIEGFKSKDIDILELVDNSTNFKVSRQFKFKDKCVFQWKRMSADEFIRVTLERNFPMEVGKFLVPDFINEIGISIHDMVRLKPLIDSLDDKHKYEKIIYDSYLLNNGFYLTEEQIKEAYKIYKKYR